MNLMEDIVLLDDVSQEYFNLLPLAARKKAALQTLPVPAFRLTGTKRGPFYVRKSDIALHIQTVYNRAASANAKMRGVTQRLAAV